MSTLGKVLAILNVLMAAAFVYLVIQVRDKQRQWAYAALRHEATLDGLPVDEQERDPRDGHLRIDVVTERLSRDLGVSPVKTQVEEVRNVQRNLQARVEGEEEANKVKSLARILLPLSPNAVRHEGLAKLAAGRDLSPQELAAVFDRALAETTSETDPEKRSKVVSDLLKSLTPEKKRQAILGWLQADFNDAFQRVLALSKSDSEEKKQAVAALLIPLADVPSDDKGPADPQQPPSRSPAYQRALAVVGVNAATRELDRQALALKKMAQDVERATAQDQTEFVQAYRQRLGQLVGFAQLVAWQNRFLDFQKEMVAEHDKLVKQREASVRDLEKELASLQDKLKKQLREQAAKEADILAKQQRLRDAFRENQRLANEARDLEAASKKGNAP
jgi:hypothetical protein